MSFCIKIGNRIIISDDNQNILKSFVAENINIFKELLEKSNNDILITESEISNLQTEFAKFLIAETNKDAYELTIRKKQDFINQILRKRSSEKLKTEDSQPAIQVLITPSENQESKTIPSTITITSDPTINKLIEEVSDKIIINTEFEEVIEEPAQQSILQKVPKITPDLIELQDEGNAVVLGENNNILSNQLNQEQSNTIQKLRKLKDELIKLSLSFSDLSSADFEKLKLGLIKKVISKFDNELEIIGVTENDLKFLASDTKDDISSKLFNIIDKTYDHIDKIFASRKVYNENDTEFVYLSIPTAEIVRVFSTKGLSIDVRELSKNQIKYTDYYTSNGFIYTKDINNSNLDPNSLDGEGTIILKINKKYLQKDTSVENDLFIASSEPIPYNAINKIYVANEKQRDNLIAIYDTYPDGVVSKESIENLIENIDQSKGITPNISLSETAVNKGISKNQKLLYDKLKLLYFKRLGITKDSDRKLLFDIESTSLQNFIKSAISYFESQNLLSNELKESLILLKNDKTLEALQTLKNNNLETYIPEFITIKFRDAEGADVYAIVTQLEYFIKELNLSEQEVADIVSTYANYLSKKNGSVSFRKEGFSIDYKPESINNTDNRNQQQTNSFNNPFKTEREFLDWLDDTKDLDLFDKLNKQHNISLVELIQLNNLARSGAADYDTVITSKLKNIKNEDLFKLGLIGNDTLQKQWIKDNIDRFKGKPIYYTPENAEHAETINKLINGEDAIQQPTQQEVKTSTDQEIRNILQQAIKSGKNIELQGKNAKKYQEILDELKGDVEQNTAKYQQPIEETSLDKNSNITSIEAEEFEGDVDNAINITSKYVVLEESFEPNDDIIQSFSEDNSIEKVEKIKTKKVNHFEFGNDTIRITANKLIKENPELSQYDIIEVEDTSDPNVLGEVDVATKTIVLYTKNIEKNKKSKDEILFHELTHAVFKIKLKDKEKIKPFIDAIVDIKENLLKVNNPYLKNYLNTYFTSNSSSDINEKISDVDEFITRILTEKELADILNQIKQNNQNLLTKIFNIFLEFLGIKNLDKKSYLANILKNVEGIVRVESKDLEVFPTSYFTLNDDSDKDLTDDQKEYKQDFKKRGIEVYQRFVENIKVGESKYKEFGYSYDTPIRKIKDDGKPNIQEFNYNLANLESNDLVLVPLMVKHNDEWKYVIPGKDGKDIYKTKIDSNDETKTIWIPLAANNSLSYNMVAAGSPNGVRFVSKDQILAIRKFSKINKDEVTNENKNAAKQSIETLRAEWKAYNEANESEKVKYLPKSFLGIYESVPVSIGDILTLSFKDKTNNSISFYGSVNRVLPGGYEVITEKGKSFFVKKDANFKINKNVRATIVETDALETDLLIEGNSLSNNPNFIIEKSRASDIMTIDEYKEYRESKDENYKFKREDYQKYVEKASKAPEVKKGDYALINIGNNRKIWKPVAFSSESHIYVINKTPKGNSFITKHKAEDVQYVAFNTIDLKKTFEIYGNRKDYKEFVSFPVNVNEDATDVNTQLDYKRIKKLKAGDTIIYSFKNNNGITILTTGLVHEVLPNGSVRIVREYQKDKLINGVNTPVIQYDYLTIPAFKISKVNYRKESHAEEVIKLRELLDKSKTLRTSGKVYIKRNPNGKKIYGHRWVEITENNLEKIFKNNNEFYDVYTDSSGNILMNEQGEILYRTPNGELVSTGAKIGDSVLMKELDNDRLFLVNGLSREFEKEFLSAKNTQGVYEPKKDKLTKLANLKRGEFVTVNVGGKRYQKIVSHVGEVSILDENNNLTKELRVFIVGGEEGNDGNVFTTVAKPEDIIEIYKFRSFKPKQKTVSKYENIQDELTPGKTQNVQKKPMVENKPKSYLPEGESVKTQIDLPRLPVQQVELNINKDLVDLINPILATLNQSGFNPLIVGGSVRDAILGNKPKDIDVEVYGITIEDLEKTLSQFGKVDSVGKSFGVLKFIPFDENGQLVQIEEPFDFSVPRRENKIGAGYKGFEVELSTDITIEEASTRRDFTWNSIGYNPITQTLYDYYGGINDLAEGIIRHTSVKFAEDPLRILRAMQFQSRMGHVIADEMYELMKQIVQSGEFDHLKDDKTYKAFIKEKERLKKQFETFATLNEHTIESIENTDLINNFPEYEKYQIYSTMITKERIVAEWTKWAQKGKYPSKIFEFLRKSGLGELLYPELLTLKETPQDAIFHPEGDVEEHTMQVLAKAADIAKRENLSPEEKEILIYSALFHDIAKPETTKEEYSEKLGRVKITAKGHEPAGEPKTKMLMERMGVFQNKINQVARIVGEHLNHAVISSLDNDKQKKSAFAKLVNRIKPATVEQLMLLMEADMLGRNNANEETPASILEFSKLLENYLTKNEGKLEFTPILSGKHLLEIGFEKGPVIGKILNAAKEAQLNLDFENESEAMEWLINYLTKENLKPVNFKSLLDTTPSETVSNEPDEIIIQDSKSVLPKPKLTQDQIKNIEELKRTAPAYQKGTDEEIQEFIDLNLNEDLQSDETIDRWEEFYVNKQRENQKPVEEIRFYNQINHADVLLKLDVNAEVQPKDAYIHESEKFFSLINDDLIFYPNSFDLNKKAFELIPAFLSNLNKGLRQTMIKLMQRNPQYESDKKRFKMEYKGELNPDALFDSLYLTEKIEEFFNNTLDTDTTILFKEILDSNPFKDSILKTLNTVYDIPNIFELMHETVGGVFERFGSVDLKKTIENSKLTESELNAQYEAINTENLSKKEKDQLNKTLNNKICNI